MAVETLETLLRTGQFERAACRLVYGLVKARANQMDAERNRNGNGKGNADEISQEPNASATE